MTDSPSSHASAPPLNRVFLALGSNIDPERNLPAAVRLLQNYGEVLRVSSVWETAPVGDVRQPNFLNAAALLLTSLNAADVRRRAIADIERELKRTRDPSNRNAARTIDVDIALFNSDCLEIDGRRIPDPDILTRVFVALPLSELDADYVHPLDGRTLRDIAGELRQKNHATLRLRQDIDLRTALCQPPPD